MVGFFPGITPKDQTVQKEVVRKINPLSQRDSRFVNNSLSSFEAELLTGHVKNIFWLKSKLSCVKGEPHLHLKYHT